MTTISHSTERKSSGMVQTKASAIALATLVVAILDALAAILVYHFFYNLSAVQVYQFVASGSLGEQAYTSSLTALLGLLVHFIVSFVSTYVFFVGYPYLRFFGQHKIASGLIYGVAVWAAMNYIIIPLSNIPASEFNLVSVLSIGWHMICVGLPISWIAHLHYVSRR